MDGHIVFIGIILFLLDAASQWSDHNPGWQKSIVISGITNMIGKAGVGGGISHIFLLTKITRSIGFKSSPYQLDVGFCDLSFGIVGFLAQYYSTDFWWAIILFSSLYRIGCGLGHIRQMIVEKNYAINDTAILITNFGVPLILIALFLRYIV